MTGRRQVPGGRSWATLVIGDWADQANCAGCDADVFYPPEVHGRRTRNVLAGDAELAKLICRECPVAAECLRWALLSTMRCTAFGVVRRRRNVTSSRRRRRRACRRWITAVMRARPGIGVWGSSRVLGVRRRRRSRPVNATRRCGGAAVGRRVVYCADQLTLFDDVVLRALREIGPPRTCTDTDYGHLAATQGDEPTEIDHPGCVAYDGPEKRWRAKAASITWIQLGVDRPSLSWPTATCSTSLCLNPGHLTWEAPTQLDYPPGICVYCGVISGTQDHLLPRTWTGDAVRHNVLVVPACGECNSCISDRYAPSITARRRLAHDAIRRRKKRILSIPDWEADEVAKLGHTLRSTIEKGLHEKRLTAARLSWPEDPDFDLRVMHLSGIKNPHEIGLLVTRPRNPQRRTRVHWRFQPRRNCHNPPDSRPSTGTWRGCRRSWPVAPRQSGAG